MKITSILFWGGMVTTIMLFALFFGLICQDIIYKRVHNGVKYFFIVPIGILCVMFFLLSTLVAGTDILSYFYQTNIYYGSKLDILFLVFAIWSLWVAIHYYGYILFPEYSKLDINIIPKERKKWILLYICTIIIGFFYDMDIPANSSICNECDNRIYINFVDIIMWILRTEILYTQGKKTMDIRIKDRPLGGDAITF